ncbi:MAG TPA: FlgD immunoglobulin-like domain containing protein [Candidatus Eisenbacteria bacterium]|nr:FlgD immunoglobulin-like domain containing protein [Candidatus Eisenbacteria bacterium]
MRPRPAPRAPRPGPRPGSRRVVFALAALLAVAFVAAGAAPPARAAFHLIEINKVLTSYNGDATIQAVELRYMSGSQNLVSGMSIRSYDAAGVALATHGTFAANLPASGAIADRKILCATSAFAATFGITPDLVIAAGLPLSTGQVSFEEPGCSVNTVAYGDVAVVVNGSSSAPAIPSGLAYVLARTASNATSPFCPLAENAAARFAIRSGSSASPVPFSNNANTTVNVFSTLTGADALLPAAAWRVYPNPFRESLRIETSAGGRVAVYDVRGALVRTLAYGSERVVGPRRLEWDGRDARGRRAPAGVYFVRAASAPGGALARVVLLR